jgi:hypothetical protein
MTSAATLSPGRPARLGCRQQAHAAGAASPTELFKRQVPHHQQSCSSRPCMRMQGSILQYLRKQGAVSEQVDACEILQFGHGQSNPTYLVQVRTTTTCLSSVPDINRCFAVTLPAHRVAVLSTSCQKLPGSTRLQISSQHVRLKLHVL